MSLMFVLFVLWNHVVQHGGECIHARLQSAQLRDERVTGLTIFFFFSLPAVSTMM